MKKTTTAFMFAYVMIFVATYSSGVRADNWNDIRISAGKITSVCGEFTQYRHMKILSSPLVSGGNFCFRTPDSLRWEYRYPVRSILLTQNGKTRRYVERDGDLVEDASANLPSMQMVVQEITNWLKGRFNENPAFTSTLEAGRKIVLVPKEQSLADLIERIEIVLSERNGVIKSVTIFEDPNSFTKIVFDKVTINHPIANILFRQP